MEKTLVEWEKELNDLDSEDLIDIMKGIYALDKIKYFREAYEWSGVMSFSGIAEQILKGRGVCATTIENKVDEKGKKYNEAEIKRIISQIENIVKNWDNRDSKTDFRDFEEIYNSLCRMDDRLPRDLEAIYNDSGLKRK